MTHGSLFSGIGGFDLASEWMGWDNKFHCEWNEFGQKILHHYWPNAEQFTDITKSNFTKYANKIDVLTGGFPCQPYSSAGKRLGKDDNRHLWPQMLRAIGEVQPRWVVGENVRGLTNWNGGVVFDEVQSDLEAAGYEVTPFLLPACAVGAVHRRDRIWFVAHRTDSRFQRSRVVGEEEELTGVERHGVQGTAPNSNNSRGNVGVPAEWEWSEADIRWEGHPQPKHREDGDHGVATNSKGGDHRGEYGFMGREEEEKGRGGEADANTEPTPTSGTGNATHTTGFGQEHEVEDGQLGGQRPRQSYKRGTWDSFPSVSPICLGNDGLPGRLDGITFPKWRNESVKAAGNAIVPHVAYQIFMAIKEYERVF